MKKSAILLRFPLLAAGVAALLFAGCSKHSRDEAADKTKDAYHDTTAAVSQGWENVKSYSYEKRSDFSQWATAQQKTFEAEASKLKADYSEAQASASRKAAMAEFKDSEANYKEKLSALGNATAETWDAARDNVAAAWDRLQASYAKARAN
jgi:hypothetical protein